MTPLPSAGVTPAPVPAMLAVTFDPATRRIDGGSTLVGGSPLTVLRLTAAGSRLVDDLERGAPVPAGGAGRVLARRLLDLGLAHPRPPAGGPEPPVTVVIPVRDDAAGLAVTLGHLGAVGQVIVVDDASMDPEGVRRVVAAGPQADRSQVLRLGRAVGPGGARQAGWTAAATDVVAFVDADCEPSPGWLGPLMAHLADPVVAAVAPRIVARTGALTPRWLAAYERLRSPLDLGPAPAAARPHGRVPYVPSTALVVRRSALVEVGGFDPGLRYGEDVDLVWRLVSAGRVVRYEPATTVSHGVRRDLGALLRQRFAYGTSAAPLALRHGQAPAPLTVSGWSGTVWAAAALGHPLLGVSVAGASIAALAARLRALRRPWREATLMAGGGHLRAGRLAADACRRAWWPLLLGGCLVSRRARRLALAVTLVPPLLERRPPSQVMSLPAWLGLRLLDDLAYGLGVWVGAARTRSTAALRPRVTGRRAGAGSRTSACKAARTPVRRQPRRRSPLGSGLRAPLGSWGHRTLWWLRCVSGDPAGGVAADAEALPPHGPGDVPGPCDEQGPPRRGSL